jgi:hypothetical protein
MRQIFREECIQALKDCSENKFLSYKELFTDVYDEMP